MSTTPERGYAKGRERREEILRVADDLFARQGFRGASLAKIAQRVGISDAGLLHHFSSKEELLVEVLRMRDEHDRERVSRALDDHGTLAEALLGLCRENEVTPGLTRLFAVVAAESIETSHPGNEFFRERYRGVRRSLAGHIEEAQARGELAPNGDPALLAAQIVAVWDGLQLQWLLDPEAVDMVGLLRDFLARIANP